MSETRIRSRAGGRPGRPSKGDRRSRTLRVPVDLDSKLEEAFEASGHADVNTYLVEMIDRNLNAPDLDDQIKAAAKDAGYPDPNSFLVSLMQLAKKAGLLPEPAGQTTLKIPA